MIRQKEKHNNWMKILTINTIISVISIAFIFPFLIISMSIYGRMILITLISGVFSLVIHVNIDKESYIGWPMTRGIILFSIYFCIANILCLPISLYGFGTFIPIAEIFDGIRRMQDIAFNHEIPIVSVVLVIYISIQITSILTLISWCLLHEIISKNLKRT